MPAPNVEVLPVPPGLGLEHYGAQVNKIKLVDEPTAFNNPWPSYRFASAADLWLSYQKGAAIAAPQLVKPKVQTYVDMATSALGALRPATRRGLFYDPDDDGEDGEDGGSEDDDSDVELGQNDTDRERIREKRTAANMSRSSSKQSLNGDDEHPMWTTYPARRHPLEGVKGFVRPALSKISQEDAEEDWREPPLFVMSPRWPSGSKPAVTWLGHASTMLHIPMDGGGMAGVLFDPIFSYRCSPTQWVGPARYLDTPCSVQELPEVHLVIISHDHYDHLDYNSIMDLWKYHQQTVHFVVPLGLLKWFVSCGISETRVTQMDWWSEAIVSFPRASGEEGKAYPPSASTSSRDDPVLRLKVACTPAQHRSGRGLGNQMSTLWASWCVGVLPLKPTGPSSSLTSTRNQPKPFEPQSYTATPAEPQTDTDPGMTTCGFKAYFAGDTGYRYASAPEGDDDAVCPAFRQIGDTYGPFSLSLLPLSTGSSLPFLRQLLYLSLDQYTLTSSQHCSPADACAIHRDVRAKRSVGMHWGTFCDAAEARATRVEFGRARRQAGLMREWEEEDSFVIAEIGETLEVDE